MLWESGKTEKTEVSRSSTSRAKSLVENAVLKQFRGLCQSCFSSPILSMEVDFSIGSHCSSRLPAPFLGVGRNTFRRDCTYWQSLDYEYITAIAIRFLFSGEVLV